jgi:SAM-dependent methyltransferase
MYEALTTKNSSALKRFSHGMRFKIALELLDPQPGDRILDFGTGDGFMLTKIRSAADCRVTGYEPASPNYEEAVERLRKEPAGGSIDIVNSLEGLPSAFNKICCLEVLEHLSEEVQRKEITRMLQLLTGDGKLIISVPIEVGLPSLLKNLARIVLGQTHGNTNLKTITRSLLGLRVRRSGGAYDPSHIGFNYHDLEKLLLSMRLEVTGKLFSPIKLLGGMVNSQVFFVLKKAAATADGDAGRPLPARRAA